MNNIFVLDKNYNKIGTLSNQGVKPLAPYFNDLFVQELETGADTYEFSTISNSYTQGCIEIGNHIMFAYKNRNELFTITSIEYSHNEGYKTVGVYAEGLNFELLEIYMEKPKVSNSGSSGGTDNDNDGDDNYDDEYADVDDIYIDENGNIIYDKDGSGLGDVTVDGNGNIIYKRSKRKDGTGDSLEFKNISYPTFIKMMLKNTGWSYVCQPGLESNKQDMRVSYDKNIYAILQDSMQTYKGVELEFRYEYNNGKVTKTVYAYNDGGRGSFVGKRFEYGTNVKGITKMQEVTHEKEDAILFVDNIGVEVTYDVDFALKSAEITDIEIGDTHYVIDSDFHPPMQIKARIGKIEISFSDPTRNKMYLANNKKIKGAVEEIEDVIDEHLDNVDDGGEGHNRLVCDCWDNTTVMEFHGSYSPDYPDFIPGDNVPQGEIQFDTSYMRLSFFITDDDEFGWAKPRIYRYNTAYDNMTNIFTDSYHVDPCIDDHFHLGRLGYAWRSGFINHISSKAIKTNSISSYVYNLPFDREDMNDVSKISDSTKQDLLDFIINDVNIYKYMPKEIDAEEEDADTETTGTYLGLLSEDFINHESDTECVWTSDMAHLIMRNIITSGGQHYNEHNYNLPALVCALIAAFQHYVGGNSPNAPSNPGTGGGSEIFETDQINCNNLNTLGLYVYRSTLEDDQAGTEIDGYSVSTETVDAEWGIFNRLVVEEQMTLPNGDVITSSSPSIFGNGNSNPGTGNTPSNPGTGGDDLTVNHLNADTVQANTYMGGCMQLGDFIQVPELDVNDVIYTTKIIADESWSEGSPEIVVARGRYSNGSAATKITPDGIEFPDGTTLTTANGDSGGGTSGGTLSGIPIEYIQQENSSMYLGTSWIDIDNDIHVKGNIVVDGISLVGGGDEGGLYLEGIAGIKFNDGSFMETAGVSGSSGSYSGPTTQSQYAIFKHTNSDTIETSLIQPIGGGDGSGTINIDGSIDVESSIRTHALVVNDPDIIGATGMIILPDGITFPDGSNLTSAYGVSAASDLSEYATIEQLQEEIRTKDEQIANLEARLARIEAMLDINNDN